MKQPRRWAAWLAALLLAASLAITPREGAASGPFIFNDPPVVDEGEPDGPPPAPARVSWQPVRWTLTIAIANGRLFVLFEPARPLVRLHDSPKPLPNCPK